MTHSVPVSIQNHSCRHWAGVPGRVYSQVAPYPLALSLPPFPGPSSLWRWVMANARKVQKAEMETAEKNTPTKKKPRSPLSQVLQ